MKTSSPKKLFSWRTISLASAIAVIVFGCSNSHAGTHKSALTKDSAASQEKPIKLRYYGGPKYPMYPT